MTANSEAAHLTEAVWREFHQRLRSYLRRRVANDADAEDLLQDVFTRIHANVHRLGDLQSVTGWVYRITRNAVIDFYRAEATRQGHFGGGDESDLDSKAPAGDSASGARSELASCIEPLLSQLAPGYAGAVALTELGGGDAQRCRRADGPVAPRNEVSGISRTPQAQRAPSRVLPHRARP